ncbi:MAG: 4'-phosphopantetheinyl transferase superfamily protein [Chitinophagaceae bacterium]|nr:4'-phosphopantetheinyl transferase superfamily protein [Chitinophagaceae bacterium]
MPVFFQHQINENTRLGIWKIEETEDFFKGNVPQHRDVTHPHKRLQHLAGRFLLQFLFPDFPYELVQIAETRKPFLSGEQYHFSISHCGDFAAAIVSRNSRVGIDIEIPVEKIDKIKNKFLSEIELAEFKIGPHFTSDLPFITLLWSAKESVFKWYGEGGVDFRTQIRLLSIDPGTENIEAYFAKTNTQFIIHYRQFEHLNLAWIIN